MTDAFKLLRSGKRYRGFLEVSGNFLPVTFNLYTVSGQAVRVRYLFPTTLAKELKEGKVLYILIEEKSKNLIAEARVVKTEEKGAVLSLDFITEDRRRFPRVRVKGLVSVPCLVRLRDSSVEGEVEDISFSSFSVRTDRDVPQGEYEVVLTHRGIQYRVKGKVVRSGGGVSVFEVMDGNGSFTELFSRVFTDLFLKAQRGV
ncbi:MAG: PilZ domain-containing protein [Aquificota bacterium]|nr:PilZ domain-containing protein [Aquificota bacterium]